MAGIITNINELNSNLAGLITFGTADITVSTPNVGTSIIVPFNNAKGGFIQSISTDGLNDNFKASVQFDVLNSISIRIRFNIDIAQHYIIRYGVIK